MTHCALEYGEVKVVAHARQRDVHDGDVEHDHELRDAGNATGSSSPARGDWSA